jgi:hypothetical protein
MNQFKRRYDRNNYDFNSNLEELKAASIFMIDA